MRIVHATHEHLGQWAELRFGLCPWHDPAAHADEAMRPFPGNNPDRTTFVALDFAERVVFIKRDL